MVVKWLKVVLIWFLNWFDVVVISVVTRFECGFKIVLVWPWSWLWQRVFEMVLTWLENGFKVVMVMVVVTWFEFGFDVVLTWSWGCGALV